MKALTVQQPWAWALVHGPKRIENRSRRSHFRGRLLIHAGKSRARLRDGGDLLPDVPADDDLVYGAIIGSVNVVECLPLEEARFWIAGRQAALHKERIAFEIVVDRELTPEEESAFACDDRFAEGPWCLICEDPWPLAAPVPWRGAQGFFNVPDDAISGANWLAGRRDEAIAR